MRSPEIWVDIPHYEGRYQVSNLGEVKSLEKQVLNSLGIIRAYQERILKPSLDGCGYLFVGLYNKGKQKLIKVHQLVAMAFLNHKPNGHTVVVDHIDNDKTNNHLDNLQLITQRENSSKDRKGTSIFTGVYKRGCRWAAQIYVKGSYIKLGTFDDEQEASIAYKNKLNEVT